MLCVVNKDEHVSMFIHILANKRQNKVPEKYLQTLAVISNIKFSNKVMITKEPQPFVIIALKQASKKESKSIYPKQDRARETQRTFIH